ncbi:MAG: hypothetical protein A3G21_05580 [Acidobacteria bacterium RIFCSPLOWO2_12_FULL_66_21]|nr:MAG: hypothetical protein A3G21_05580 [Acidobacteria bacterium RIFCSPLOWO2_12_FULL_66_21]
MRRPRQPAGGVRLAPPAFFLWGIPLASSDRAHIATVVTLLALAPLVTGSADGGSARQSRPASERPAGLIVDFIAVQADGTPALDLESSEVEVRINGRVRPVRSIRRVATAPVPAAPDAAPGAPVPFGTNDTIAAGRSFVLVVDEQSLTAGQAQLFRSAVEGLLPGLTPADQTMVVALPYAGVKVPFTSDTARIRLAVAGLSAQGTRNETGSDLACRTRQFLESLDGFLHHHAGRSSPLTVVLFTAGLAAPRRDAPMALAPGMCELLVSHFQRITVAAGAARANFFVAQPDDVGMTGVGWRESIGGTGYLGSDNPLEGIEHIAGATGAVRLPLDATGTKALLRVARESAAYYVAELDPERDEIFGRSRSLGVRVLRRDVTVRARPEITFAEPSRGAATIRLALPDLLASREPFTDLPLRAAGFTVREPGARLRIGVVVEPVDPLASLASVGAVLVDGAGGIVARWVASDTLGRPLLGAMTAPRGTYRLRVVAIDSAGRIGAAEDVVEIGLTSVGPLSLGSLLLGVSRYDTLVPQLHFSTEPAAIASFDIYGGAAGMRVSATLEVSRDLNGPPLVTVPLALSRADEGRVVATGAVPIGALAPGDYVVHGVIRLEDGTTGRVTRTLRKALR